MLTEQLKRFASNPLPGQGGVTIGVSGHPVMLEIMTSNSNFKKHFETLLNVIALDAAMAKEIPTTNSRARKFDEIVMDTPLEIQSADITGQLMSGFNELVDIKPLQPTLRGGAAIHTTVINRTHELILAKGGHMNTYQEIEEPTEIFNAILPNLFMGGTSDHATINIPQKLNHFKSKRDFDCIVTLFAWASPANWSVEERRLGFPDAQIVNEYLDAIHKVATWGHSRWKLGKKVLIRCQAGINRSGLLTALVLINEGYSPSDAIALIREKRSSWALCNSDYVSYLNSLGGRN